MTQLDAPPPPPPGLPHNSPIFFFNGFCKSLFHSLKSLHIVCQVAHLIGNWIKILWESTSTKLRLNFFSPPPPRSIPHSPILLFYWFCKSFFYSFLKPTYCVPGSSSDWWQNSDLVRIDLDYDLTSCPPPLVYPTTHQSCFSIDFANPFSIAWKACILCARLLIWLVTEFRSCKNRPGLRLDFFPLEK